MVKSVFFKTCLFRKPGRHYSCDFWASPCALRVFHIVDSGCFVFFRFPLCTVFQAGAFRFWLSGNLQKKYSIARESNAHVMHMFLSMLLFDMFDVLSILSYSLNFRHYVCVTTLRQCICWRMRTRTDPQIPQIEVKSRRSCHRFNFCYNL